jgi:broad-specificity NMP kinase
MRRTFVISGFPGVGKSYCCKKYGDLFKMIDSDSSEFSWIKDKDGNNTKERNPEFPNNYIEHIKSNIGEVDVIFVSSHDIVRGALAENNIKTILIYPDRTLKNDWIERLERRGSSEDFVKFISNNWYKFNDEMRTQNFPGFLKIVFSSKNNIIDDSRLKMFFESLILREFLN